MEFIRLVQRGWHPGYPQRVAYVRQDDIRTITESHYTEDLGDGTTAIHVYSTVELTDARQVTDVQMNADEIYAMIRVKPWEVANATER